MKKYRCPSPNAFGDCPCYDKNGYCSMVNDGSNPLEECDDAMYYDGFETNWEYDNISIEELGIVRRLNELGQIVIPKEIRRNLGLKENSAVEFFAGTDEEGNKYLMLTPYK